MQDFEKLGAFYLGRRFDETADALTDELILYDSKDLTTHAVIIGMTGSGKTGLGVGLIEEAALDHVPVIAIDPKGDLGNLLLSFPKLSARSFEPWVDPRAAAEAGQEVPEFAAATATMVPQVGRAARSGAGATGRPDAGATTIAAMFGGWADEAARRTDD